MKKLICLIAVACLALAGTAQAQLVGKADTVTSLGPCNAGREDRIALVTDATSAVVLGAGGGAVNVWVRCISGTWTIQEVAAVTDLTGYVPVSKAGQQSIAATGAGNDITLTTLASGDDLIFVAGDDLTFYTGDSAGGKMDFYFGGDGSMTLDNNGLTANGVYSAVSMILQADSAADAGNSKLQVNADDGADSNAIILTSTAATATVTAAITVDGTNSAVAVDAAGGVDELGVADKVVSVAATVMLRLVQQATPPAACAAGTEGGLYLDADTHLLCVCNATGWVQVADGTTGCS